MAHHKATLPIKVCPVCQRPFKWRKKWQHNWQAVKYCSKRCASNKTLRELDNGK